LAILPGMLWVLLWVVLVLAAVVVLGLLGLSLWRKAKALTREIGTASDRLAAVSDSLSDLSAQATARAPGGAHHRTRDLER
jgi:hypothetical protein